MANAIFWGVIVSPQLKRVSHPKFIKIRKRIF